MANNKHAKASRSEPAERTTNTTTPVGVAKAATADEQITRHDHPDQPATAGSEASVLVRLRELVTRAKQGDREVVPELRRVLNANPGLWKNSGDLAVQAQASWIKVIAGGDLHFRELLARQLNDMKQRLSGPDSSPLENLLVERVVATWLRLWHAETLDAQQDETSPKWAEFRLKRLKAAHDLHAKSIGALAALRKLVPPEPAPPAVLPAPKVPQPIGNANGHDTGNNGRKVNGHAHRLTGLLRVGGAQTAE